MKVKLKLHPWFVALHAHPGFKSRTNKPYLLFSGFMGADLRHQEKEK